MPEPAELDDNTSYEVKLNRPVTWPTPQSRPLRPDQKHWFTGKVIKDMRADTTNNGAIEVVKAGGPDQQQ